MSILKKKPAADEAVVEEFNQYLDENETPDHDDRAQLHEAMLTVEAELTENTESVEQVEVDFLDEQIVKNFEEQMTVEQVTEEVLSDSFDHPESDVASARILEIQNKQEMCRGMHAAIVDGSRVLERLADRAGQLSTYLEKAEIEIAHLENVETQSVKLKVAAKTLTGKHHELAEILTEKKQQIAILESQKTSARELVEKTRDEIAQLTEENSRLQSDVDSHKSTSVKLENDKLVLSEKTDLIEQELNELTVKHTSVVQANEELMASVQNKEKELAQSKSKLVDLDQMVESYRVDLADTRAKHENLNAKYVATKSEQDENKFLIESSKREFEEKLRRREKRTAELEAQSQVLSRQSAFNEDKIAELSHQLRAAGLLAQEQGELSPEKMGVKKAKKASKSSVLN